MSSNYTESEDISWTNEELDLLNNMYQYGVSVDIIAKALERTRSDIKKHICNSSMDSFPLNEFSNDNTSIQTYDDTVTISSSETNSDTYSDTSSDTNSRELGYEMVYQTREGFLDRLLSNPAFIVLSSFTIYICIVIYGKIYPL